MDLQQVIEQLVSIQKHELHRVDYRAQFLIYVDSKVVQPGMSILKDPET